MLCVEKCTACLHKYVCVYTSVLYVDVLSVLITVECVVCLQVCCMFTNELCVRRVRLT